MQSVKTFVSVSESTNAHFSPILCAIFSLEVPEETTTKTRARSSLMGPIREVNLVFKGGVLLAPCSFLDGVASALVIDAAFPFFNKDIHICENCCN